MSLEKTFVTEVAIRRPFHLVFTQNMHEKNFGKTFLNPFFGRAYCSKLCLNKHMENSLQLLQNLTNSNLLWMYAGR